MEKSIYLSVDFPVKGKFSEDEHMDHMVAFNLAISAFVHVILGRRKLVWSGHPEVYSQIEHVANKIGVDAKSWVEICQSRKSNEKANFVNPVKHNVIFTQIKEGKRDRLFEAREVMLTEQEFSHAVFIGGGKRSLDEYEHFAMKQPSAKILPITSTGGATIEIAKLSDCDSEDFKRMDDLIMMFYRNLDISVQEKRFDSPRSKFSDIFAEFIENLKIFQMQEMADEFMTNLNKFGNGKTYNQNIKNNNDIALENIVHLPKNKKNINNQWHSINKKLESNSQIIAQNDNKINLYLRGSLAA